MNRDPNTALLDLLVGRVFEARDDVTKAATASSMTDGELWLAHGTAYNAVSKRELGEKLRLRPKSEALRHLEALRAEVARRGPEFHKRALAEVAPRFGTPTLEQMLATTKGLLGRRDISPDEKLYGEALVRVFGAELARRAAGL